METSMEEGGGWRVERTWYIVRAQLDRGQMDMI